MEDIRAKDIIRQNMREAKDSLERRRSVYDAHIKELAYILVREVCQDDTDELDVLCDRLREQYSDFVTRIPFEQCDNDMGVRFCAWVADEIAEKGIIKETIPDFEELFGTDEIRVARLPNRLADEAYALFAERIGRLDPNVIDNIADVCEDVVYGRSELCMLPVYSSADGIMHNVCRHIVKNGLSPVMLCDLSTDDDFFVRFALLASAPCKTQKADAAVVTVIGCDPNDVFRLSYAIDQYGGSVVDINSLAFSIYEGTRAWQIIFSTHGADILKIYIFLAVHFRRFEINGICEIITEDEL